MPQLCSELFRTFSSQTKKGELEYQIHASYVEIYAHRVYDLLAPDPPGKAGARPGPSGHGLPECALKETWDGEWLVRVRVKVGFRVRVRVRVRVGVRVEVRMRVMVSEP